MSFSATQDLLQIDHLTTEFAIPQAGFFKPPLGLKAVNDVTFSVREGETLGIVGESGCGKSTLGRSILRLIEPTAGNVVWRGKDLSSLSREEMRQARRHMQIIFQDPVASLDPRMTVGQIIGEPLDVFEPGLSRQDRTERIAEMMRAVGLTPEMINRYPHEFSGGQAQRIGIARAIVTRPQLIVCDEPVSALDVSIQAQIIQLLKDLKDKFGLTLLFISHDLSVVRLISDRIMVLYLGKIVEFGETADVFSNPQHPYTKALLSAAPIPDPKVARDRDRIRLEGDVPSPINPPSGCAFRTRCPQVQARCAQETPVTRETASGSTVACWYVE
jgi:oligopeptide transport system ATP-binding protein